MLCAISCLLWLHDAHKEGTVSGRKEGRPCLRYMQFSAKLCQQPSWDSFCPFPSGLNRWELISPVCCGEKVQNAYSSQQLHMLTKLRRQN